MLSHQFRSHAIISSHPSINSSLRHSRSHSRRYPLIKWADNNIILTQLLLWNQRSYEYVASTLDRVKDAALKQADAMLEMPIMTPVSADTWGVKEAVMSEEDMPEWGSQEERGIEMEITTAAAVLAGGSDAVILRHPEAIKTIAKMISALM